MRYSIWVSFLLVGFFSHGSTSNNEKFWDDLDNGNYRKYSSKELVDISNSYANQNNDSFHMLFGSLVAKAREDKDNHLLSTLYMGKCRFSVDEVYLDSAKWAVEQCDDNDLLFKFYTNAGGAYGRLGKSNVAMSMYLEGLKIAKSAEDSVTMLGNIANVHINFRKFDEAKAYLNNVLKIINTDTSISTEEISTIYNAYGRIYLNTGMYDSAKYYYDMGIKLPGIIKSTQLLLYENIGIVHQLKGDFDKAEEHFIKVLEGAKQYGISHLRNYAYEDLSRLFKMKGDYQKALIYAKQRFQYAKEKNILESQMEGAMELAVVYAELNNYKKAYEYRYEYEEFYDSLYHIRNTENINKLKLEHEFDKERELKNQEISFAQSANRRKSIGLVVIGLLAAGLLLFYFKLRKSNKTISENNNKLRELDETKTRFFTNVSHELRTPLTLISGPLEQLLENDNALSSKARNYAKLSLINAKKLHGRVNEILDLGKIESGELATENNAVKISPFISRLVQAFESLVALRGVKIKYDSSVNNEQGVLSDTNKLEKVVNNLLSNAVKFAPNNTDIIVELSQNENLYSLKVTDAGPGVPEGEKEKIFDRYYQSKSGKILGGTGIGLALSRELAKILGGDIILQKTDNGASFLFSFRAETTNEALVPNEEVTILDEDDTFDVSKEFGETPNILVVEDNNEMREYIKSLLKTQYNVFEAADGQKGFEILQTQKIDLITSDVMMPNRDGFEFLSQVKADKELRNIPFVMLTARADESDKLQALNENVDDYIVKPFYAKELEARVNNLLIKYKERQNNPADSSENLQDETDELLGKIKAYIQAHISEVSLDAESLASEYSMSTATLNRKLKSAIGLTSSAYIKELRLAYARELLKSKQYSTVKEVSAACGFTRANYFAKEFTKRYGKTPSEYFG